jgi:simple sugar transport system permease protein
MVQRIKNFITKNRRYIPMMTTAILAVLAYAVGAWAFAAMRSPQVFLNMFRNTAAILISAVGMTMVILSKGIDLSVSGVVVLTTVVSASMLRDGHNPWLVILICLGIGMTLGILMGSLIVYLKVQPFIATLAGLWFSRGMCFFISDNAINIDNRIFRILGHTRILIPGLKELADSQGNPAPYVSIPVVVAFFMLFMGILITKYTRFGRNIYAIGGDIQSARLMGLPVNRTLLMVYTLNGLCSAIAGLAFALFVGSGHGLYAPGFEMDVIASVVMGGTLLSGGSGLMIGTLFGVSVLAISQTLIQFIGSLSSWWTRIVIGLLTLLFIGVQSILAAQKEGAQKTPEQIRTRRFVLIGGGVAFLIVLGIFFIPNLLGNKNAKDQQTAVCEVPPYRKDEAAEFVVDGALLAYNRTAGPECVDELFAIYPDGRIVGNNGVNKIESQITQAEVEQLLTTITTDYEWFTNEIYDTYHNPCRQCFTHYIIISYNGKEKSATGVDGGTDMPPDYGFTLSVIRPVLPKFHSSDD